MHYASCQGAHPIRAPLATCYGLDGADVRVVTADVGGSFGAKARAYPEELLLPAARQAGRAAGALGAAPRSDDMVGLGHSRAQRQHGPHRRASATAPSQCLEVHVLADAGAYPVASPR